MQLEFLLCTKDTLNPANISQFWGQAVDPLGVNAVDRYYKYSTRVNLREPPVDPNEPEVKYVVRERLCGRLFCPPGARQTVADGAAAVTPSRWLSCGDLDTADVESGHHGDSGNLLSVCAAARDGMMSSDPELYNCSSK